MKLLLKLILAMIAGVVISYALLIDRVVEELIKQEGSKYLRATVELDNADFSLLSMTLTLDKLALTNPYAPEKNLLAIETLRAQINRSALFRRQLIIEQLDADGVQLQQPRNNSGAIAGITPVAAPQQTTSLQTLIGNASSSNSTLPEAIQQELTALTRQSLDLRSQWQSRYETFNQNRQLTRFKQRWNALQSATAPQKLSGLRELKKAVNSELASTGQLAEELQTDIAVADALREQINQALQPSGNTAASAYNGPSPGELLFSERLRDTLARTVMLYRDSQRTTLLWPVLIKTLRFTTTLDTGNQPLPLNGEIVDLAIPQQRWNVATTITTKDADNRFVLRSTIDHRTVDNHNDSLTITLNELPLTALLLSATDGARVTLGQAIASGTLQLTIKSSQMSQQPTQQLQLAIDAQFKQAQLIIETNTSGSSNIGSPDNSLITQLADSVRTIDRFALQITAGGNVDNAESMQLTTRSSLDPLLTAAVNQFLATHNSNAAVSIAVPGLGEFDKTRNELLGYSQTISAYQRELAALLSSL